MSKSSSPLLVEDIDRWVNIARQIHDKCPSDHAGDHWPIGNIAMQCWMLEENQNAQIEILKKQAQLVYGTWALVAATMALAAVTILQVLR